MVREEWILSHWPSSILRKNTSRAGGSNQQPSVLKFTMLPSELRPLLHAHLLFLTLSKFLKDMIRSWERVAFTRNGCTEKAMDVLTNEDDANICRLWHCKIKSLYEYNLPGRVNMLAEKLISKLGLIIFNFHFGQTRGAWAPVLLHRSDFFITMKRRF